MKPLNLEEREGADQVVDQIVDQIVDQGADLGAEPEDKEADQVEAIKVSLPTGRDQEEILDEVNKYIIPARQPARNASQCEAGGSLHP